MKIRKEVENDDRNYFLSTVVVCMNVARAVKDARNMDERHLSPAEERARVNEERQ